MIAAVLALAGLALWGAAATIVVVARDGYRRVPTAAVPR
jgi:hypothetical protein